jgi:hypothetical protein
MTKRRPNGRLFDFAEEGRYRLTPFVLYAELRAGFAMQNAGVRVCPSPSEKAVQPHDFFTWRRRGDSNSRSRFPRTNDLANRPLQPLGYSSVFGAELPNTTTPGTTRSIIAHYTGVGIVPKSSVSIDIISIICYNRDMTVRSLLKSVRVSALIAVIIAATLALGSNAHAAGFNMSIADGATAARGTGQSTDLFGQTGTFRTITNVMLYLIGAISVIMLIIGGLRYVVSGGDSTAVQNAKNTILYAVVGIIVAILAYAVVSFVISSFSGTSGGSSIGGTVSGQAAAPTNK